MGHDLLFQKSKKGFFLRGIAMSIAIIYVSVGLCHAQSGRIFGAGAFQIDDGKGKTITWDVQVPISTSYNLHLPSVPPPNAVNFMATDANGDITWTINTLPPLAPGNIWYGNSSSVATQLAPMIAGAVLSLNNSLMPEWTTTLPSSTTVSANQLTSGTLPPGTVIEVGSGSKIEPNGGTINANLLSGSGAGKYSGKIDIPAGIDHLDIFYSGIMDQSSITVSVFDPQAKNFGFVDAKVSGITPGVSFRVIFSADYPNSGTGELHYIVINP
jgi:hypothetical protein